MTVVQYRLNNGKVVNTYREAILSGMSYEMILSVIEGRTLQELLAYINTD